MVKNKVAKVVVGLATSIMGISVAYANLTLNPTHIALGVQQRHFTPNALNPYFNNDYTHDESEHMMGMYAGFNINIQEQFLIEAEGDFATKVSKGIGMWRLGAGFVPYRSGVVSIPITAGVINYDSSTDKDNSAFGKSESAAYVKVGISAFVAPRWLMDLNIQYETFDISKTSVNFDNTFYAGFQLFSVPILEDIHPTLGLSWSDRNSREVNIRVGAKYTFN